MTDLERVRETLTDEGNLRALDELDAHLKEDAERDRALAAAQEAALTRPSREREVIAEMDDEITRLREQRDRAEAIAFDHAAELTRLREENERLSKGMNRFSVVVKQRDRLREELDLKDGLLNQAKGELARLRESETKWANEASERTAENARLREDARDMEQRLRRKVIEL